MLNLFERQVGFALDKIGFPSIDGCHAVVLVTKSGLYGFHNFGGSSVAQFDERSKSFASFVKEHFASKSDFVHLYGTCFRDKRGFDEGVDPFKGWKNEMKAFAKAIGYKGYVSGYDLSKKFGPKYAGSAYVEYQKALNGATIHCKSWNEMEAFDGEITDRANHKMAANGGYKNITSTKSGANEPAKRQTGVRVVSGPVMQTVVPGDVDRFKV